MILSTSVAAATAALGYDTFTNQIFKRSGAPRAVDGHAMCGSNAAGDTAIDFYIDNVKIGTFYNTTTGFPTKDHLMPLNGAFVPAGTDMSSIVIDAASTNPLNQLVDIRQLA